MNTLIQQFKAARFASTPLVCIRTADPAQTIRSIMECFNGSAPPMLHWDIIRGTQALNEQAQAAIASMVGTVMPIPMLESAAKLPPKSILFMANVHRIIAENGVSQAIWNLRDQFKKNKRCLVMLCPSMTLPVELASDVTVLDEPLPDMGQLGDIIHGIYNGASIPLPSPEILAKATDAVCGLAAFPAEQATAESITPDGLDLDALWERKRKSIEETPGLSVWRGGQTFDDMRGCQNAIRFFKMTMNGLEAPRVVVWADEIEKQVAGFGTDTSGSKTGIVGRLLTHMANRYWNGVLLIGPPGSGKSMLAQCCGATFAKPTIGLDLGAIEGSLVGESAAKMENALKVIDAVGQGSAMVVATCNSFGSMPPELRRRFKDATFFCDLPTEEELVALWSLYTAKYNIPQKHRAVLPESRNWTGAEVRNCCDMAHRFQVPLTEVAPYIVPVFKSAARDIAMLRQQAHETFISASYPGPYRIPESEEASVVAFTGSGRELKFGKDTN